MDLSTIDYEKYRSFMAWEASQKGKTIRRITTYIRIDVYITIFSFGK